jgi:heat-inducible transcriptional repressor
MAELTNRQKEILRRIIEEYIETAEPVGSEALEKKYSFGVSPATIRHEMARLTKEGYLRQPHTSAGRTPTPLGLKLYVTELMEEKKMSVTEEVAAKEKVWDWRHDFARLIREATKSLAEQTRYLAVSATDEGDIFHAGHAHILDMPEFYDIDVTKTVLGMLDQLEMLKTLFGKSFSENPVKVLLGEDLGYEYLEPCGMVFTHFETPRHKGSLGIVGPSRFDFPRVIPIVRYHGELIANILKNW